MNTESISQNTLDLEALDALLAQHAFGNSDYITEQLHVCYKRRLRKISAHLPVAGQLLDTLCRADPYSQYRVIGDTVVRCAVQHAHKQVETDTQYGLPLEQCEEVFRETIRLLEEGKYGSLGSGLVSRLGPDSYHGWIWSEGIPDDVFARSFRFVLHDNDYCEQLYTPNADELAMLGKGAQLLSELCPLSSCSALSHAHLIAVFPRVGTWTARASSSEFRVSGTVFLSRKLLSNPWWVAEHLFHEALHQQLYDFRQGHSLLEPNFDREGAPLIHSLWNMPDSTQGNYWDIHRALAAFHVYVHLALLSTVAEQRASDLEDEYGPIKMVGSRTALVRAHYLVEQIRSLCWQELGQAGKRFVDWFSSVLDLLDPSSPPQGSYVHLLLDRYWKEANKLEYLLSKPEPRSDLSHQLMMLIKDEVKSTHSVLTEVNGDFDRFNDALASFSDEEPVTQFVRVRTLIAKTILKLSPDGYRLSESKVPDEMVKQMVERSSEILQILLAR